MKNSMKKILKITLSNFIISLVSVIIVAIYKGIDITKDLMYGPYVITSVMFILSCILELTRKILGNNSKNGD